MELGIPELLFLLGFAQFLDHSVITVSGIIVHIEPEINRNALVTLSHVMVPQAGQEQQIALVYPKLVSKGFAKLRIPLCVRTQRVNVHPIDVNDLFRCLCEGTGAVL